jgi:hypothetical protein
MQHLKPPYSLGVTEDVPGERYIVIGGQCILFARIPDIDDRMRDTARFLVTACNLHGELVAACRAALDRLESLEYHDADTIGWSPAVEMLRAVLAKLPKGT